MYSEKIASDLILNEEREKTKKKNPKKKKTSKKKGIQSPNSMATPTSKQVLGISS